MDFMHAAVVRRCIREGLVKLPVKETLLLTGVGPVRKTHGLDSPVCSHETLHLRPGEHSVVRIHFGQSNRNPQREVAGRGDRWVTQLIYGGKRWSVVVKAAYISSRRGWIDTRTALARIVELGYFTTGKCVRPGLKRYQESESLIYENAVLRERRLRE
ncbi:LOW QUALITY PROTEIN: hypothetical protein PHMEG_0005646 [Phytophthora megakarya]|uniref:Uncharacterized protein n=1 Tax=Phytophthora megakarya TaxID=4795 RepID=A0A225WQL0_9STRA|nr:LOW QUALITY PROTEIN: hypothetical protein PHMEG_0005646 [Phytophthora megakarya]